MTQHAPALRGSRAARAAAVALLGIAAALAAGCSQDAAVLARIGDRVIDRAEFESVARANVMNYPGVPDSAKRQLLSDLVRRELLLVAARQRGLGNDTLPAAARRAAQDRLLAQALFERIAPRDVPVSEAEVAQFHRWRGTRAHVKLIFTLSRSAAAGAAAALRRGERFEALAERTNLPGMLPGGGDLGWITAGQLVNPLDRLAREAPVGVPQGPIEAPGEGWFVMLVTERQKNTAAPLELERPYLTDMLRQRKMRMISFRAFERLSREYAVQVEPRGPQILFARMNELTAVGGTATPPSTADDDQVVLARFNGGRWDSGLYTLADAMRDAADPASERVSTTSTYALQSWIENNAVRRAAVVEARRQHLDEEPEVARRIRASVDNDVLQRAYNELVTRTLSATDDEARAFYAANAKRYQQLASARLATLETADSAAAALAAVIARSNPIEDAARQAGLPAPRTIEVSFPSPDPTWSPLQMELQAGPEGEVVGPLRVPAGWRVAKLVSKTVAQPPFETLPPAMQDNLRNQVMARKAEQRLTEVTNQARATCGRFEVHPERLRFVVWPAVAAPSGVSLGS